MPKNGFDVPSDFTSFDEEANRANFNDRGKDNVRITEGGAVTVKSYSVSEETRLMPLPGSDSIQSVSYRQIAPRPTFNAEARAELRSTDNGKEYRLVGHSNGKVMLHSTNLTTGAAVSVDITDNGFDSLDANEIRHMQKSISSDGEVNRDEQLRIIRMMTNAKVAANVM